MFLPLMIHLKTRIQEGGTAKERVGLDTAYWIGKVDDGCSMRAADCLWEVSRAENELKFAIDRRERKIGKKGIYLIQLNCLIDF
jgi:hypothetical protein